MDEKEWALLMRAGNAGDADSYRRLLLQLTPVFRRIARRGLAGAGMADTDAEDVVQETLADDSEPSMLVADVDRHLECLPAGQRKVVRAITVDGASISEAAARLSMTNGAVRVALHRGLAALAAKFNGEGT